MNISAVFFLYKITSVNSQHENTNSKLNFVLKMFVLKISDIKKIKYETKFIYISIAIWFLSHIYDVPFKKEGKILSEWKRER